MSEDFYIAALPPMIGVDWASKPDISSIAVQTGKTVIPVIENGSVVINRQFITGLNANRKADRDLLAGVFTVIAEARGATVERRDDPPNPGYHGRSVALRFACEGVGAMLDIDSLHGGRYSLISWHNHYGHRERGDPIPSSEGPITRHFAPRFNFCVGATHSARPHHKATSCGADWYSIAMYLDAGLMLAASGRAFTA